MKYYYVADEQRNVFFMTGPEHEEVPEGGTELTYDQYRAALNYDRTKQEWKLIGDQPKLVEWKLSSLNV